MNRKSFLIGLYSFGIALEFTGCAGTSGLRKSIQSRQSTLGYLHDGSVRVDRPAGISAYQLETAIPPESEVKRTRSLIIPTLIFNSWSHDFEIRLGEKGVTPSPLDFGRKSLSEDLQRAGAGSGVRAKGLDDTRISVKINTLKSEAAFHKSGYFYFLFFLYGWGYHSGVRDLSSSLDAEITIFHNSRLDTLFYQHTEYAEVPKQIASDNLDQTMVSAMVETLSLCFKDMNSKIIAALAKK